MTRILRNRKYIGLWPWGANKNVRNPMTDKIRQEKRSNEETEKWVRPFTHLRIIDDETFAEAQQLLAKSAELHARHRDSNRQLRGSTSQTPHCSPRHLLSGLIRCSECERSLVVVGKIRRDAGRDPRAANRRLAEARLLSVERAARHTARGVRPRCQGGASHRGMLPPRQELSRLGGLRSSDVAGLALSSNVVAVGHMVPHAGNPAGEKNPRRRSPSRRVVRCWLRRCIGNSTAIIPRSSAGKPPVDYNGTKLQDSTTGKNVNAWCRSASINGDNQIQSN